MVRIVILLVLAAVAAGPAAAKYAAIVVDHRTGRVLHAVNADTRNYPASLTKMMTLFMTFEALRDGKLRPDQRLPVSYAAQSRQPSRLGLRRGQVIAVRDAIRALVTKSANDVATVLAEAMGGTERKFARMMTKRARRLGMRSTTFKNASGLPNRAQLSTARDMAVLSRALLRQFPRMYGQFSRKAWKWRGRSYRNHNRLMSRYHGMDGIKTGYTRASGFNLAASAKRGGRRLVAVVFGGRTARSRDRQVAKLLDRGFAALGATRIAKQAAGARRAAARKPAAPVRAARKSASSRAAAARKAPTRRRTSGGAAGWAIQIGVYHRYAPARGIVARATRVVPGLRNQPVKIVEQKTRKRGRKLYKARLLMASKTRARDYCRALKRRRMDCLVVRTGARS